MAQSKPLVGESHNIDRKLKPQLRGDQAGLYTMDLQVLGPFVIYVNTSLKAIATPMHWCGLCLKERVVNEAILLVAFVCSLCHVLKADGFSLHSPPFSLGSSFEGLLFEGNTKDKSWTIVFQKPVVMTIRPPGGVARGGTYGFIATLKDELVSHTHGDAQLPLVHTHCRCGKTVCSQV